jgi:hypothetical protein
MESITTKSVAHVSEGYVFEIGSLYSYFSKISDKRKPKGLRYP